MDELGEEEPVPGSATCDTPGCPAYGLETWVADGNAATMCGQCMNIIPTTPGVVS